MIGAPERPPFLSASSQSAVEPNAETLEFKCVEFIEELMVGKLRKEPLPMVDDFRRWYDGLVPFPQLAGRPEMRPRLLWGRLRDASSLGQ